MTGEVNGVRGTLVECCGGQVLEYTGICGETRETEYCGTSQLVQCVRSVYLLQKVALFLTRRRLGLGRGGGVSWEHLEGRQTVVCVVQAVPEKGCECNGMAWGSVFMGKRREHRRIGKRQEGPHRAAGAREGSTYLGRHVHVPQYLPSTRVSAQSVHRPAVCGGGREDVPCAVPGTELGGPPPQRLPVDQPQLLIFQIDPPLQHADDNML